MKKIPGLTLGAACLGLILVGCDSSGGTASVSSADLIGKWVINKQSEKGSIAFTAVGQPEYKLPLDTSYAYSASDNFYVQFDSSGSYSANFPGLGTSFQDTGSWKVSGNTITTISTNDDTTLVSAAISGKSGTFTIPVHYSIDDSAGTAKYDYDATMLATKQ